ncbi:molybdopterin converting factor subunit 1 [Methylotuvimicrobium buryatense]|uniref:Molybdopterin synthase sulfur carrier subunit n=1 Tax=Methylotuvimicrobium buryatense TaxID=95641 RepID=A0A4V1IJI4_METBY|nr:molybdopterin converting factor subunit 1 [Methylotuvimicrobium buryatense]QCW81515.1 molybdopterin converting factor subunit 1 [Methylotuvimicrobium buryatense]
MSVKVRYFASLKDSVGRSDDMVDVNGAVTVAEIWAMANANRLMPDNILAAVNMEYVDIEHSVQNGDEVAFFPPVTGG